MSKFSAGSVVALLLFVAASGAVLAVDNPLVVDLHGAKTASREASATIFGSGSTVLVNVTADHAIPAGVAITLNTGDCTNPGDIAFALTGFADNQSLTELKHPLSDIAGKAKSMVIHQTPSQTSAPLACGKVPD